MSERKLLCYGGPLEGESHPVNGCGELRCPGNIEDGKISEWRSYADGGPIISFPVHVYKLTEHAWVYDRLAPAVGEDYPEGWFSPGLLGGRR